ncbi:MAG: T9SS type A sorting domain-containing protein [Prevotellaceae bacterium]|nr:T9SS type A sorting domain-containing protein [Candidatus Minthosoma caballi]
MKKLLLAILLMVGAVPSFALDKQFYELVLFLKDGTTVTYQLEEKVVMTFEEKTVVLKTEEMTAEYALEDISSFDQREAEVPQAVENVTAANVKGDVVIYDMNGRLVRRIAPNESQKASFMLRDLDNGVYVIKNGVTTYKFMKR